MTHGVNDFFDFATATVPADALGSVHFLAIGGSGMSGLMFINRSRRKRRSVGMGGRKVYANSRCRSPPSFIAAGNAGGP